MKHTKLLLVISIVFMFRVSVSAQNFYTDSSVYFTVAHAPSVSEGVVFLHYLKETLILDSTNTSGAFYSVQYYSHSQDSLQDIHYQLKVKNDSVYFSGTLRNDNQDSFFLQNVLIYDFSQKVGDTLSVNHSASGLQYQLKIDSIRPKTFADNVSRDVFYYRILSSNNEYPLTTHLYAIKGLASSVGLLPFKLTHRDGFHRQMLVSVCKQSEVILSTGQFFSQAEIGDFCSEDSFKRAINKIYKMSVNTLDGSQTVVYPNPAHDEVTLALQIEPKNAQINIYNSQGVLIKTMVWQGAKTIKINLQNFSAGIYMIAVSNENQKFYNKLQVIE